MAVRAAEAHAFLSREAVANLVAPEALALIPAGAEVGVVCGSETDTGARFSCLGDAAYLRSFLIYGRALGFTGTVVEGLWVGDDIPRERFPVEIEGWPEDWLAELQRDG